MITNGIKKTSMVILPTFHWQDPFDISICKWKHQPIQNNDSPCNILVLIAFKRLIICENVFPIHTQSQASTINIGPPNTVPITVYLAFIEGCCSGQNTISMGYGDQSASSVHRC